MYVLTTVLRALVNADVIVSSLFDNSILLSYRILASVCFATLFSLLNPRFPVLTMAMKIMRVSLFYLSALLVFLSLLTNVSSFAPIQKKLNHHRPTVLFATSSEEETKASPTTTTGIEDATQQAKNEKLISDFCIGTNAFWKSLVIEPVRNYVEIRPGGTSDSDVISKLTAPPEVPGIPRPVWLTILGSVPTALGWYGYYKFSVEEELYQAELQKDGKASGCGGYGTLFP